MPPGSPVAEANVETIVTLADSDLHRVDAVAKSLKRKGFRISHILENSGLIAGTGTRQMLEALRKVKGVAAVEISGEISIAPPEAHTQ